MSETLSTLRFGIRAKKITNKPQMDNNDIDQKVRANIALRNITI